VVVVVVVVVVSSLQALARWHAGHCQSTPKHAKTKEERPLSVAPPPVRPASCTFLSLHVHRHIIAYHTASQIASCPVKQIDMLYIKADTFFRAHLRKAIQTCFFTLFKYSHISGGF